MPPSEPLVSVVVPVYDTAAYLEACLDSILGQSLADIEVLCLDDGSTDGSSQILADYAEQDPRVRVLAGSPDTRGPGRARNLGIAQATGGYVAFIDSDDLVDPEMLRKLHDKAEQLKADVAMCLIRKFDDAEGRHLTPCTYDRHIPASLDEVAFSWRDIGTEVFSLRFASCNKLYRRDYLHDHDLRYGEDAYYEDLVFSFRSLLETDRLALVREPLYLNRKLRPGATTFVQGDRVLDAVPAMEALSAYLDASEHRDELEAPFAAFRFRKLYSYLSFNDGDSVVPFVDGLRRSADHPALEDGAWLSEEEQEVRRRVLDSDLQELLLWEAWRSRVAYGQARRRAELQRAKAKKYRRKLRKARRQLPSRPAAHPAEAAPTADGTEVSSRRS